MSGRGKGRHGSKRHAKVERGRVGISKPGFRRFAREVGVKRISLACYEQLDAFLKIFLQRLASDSVVLTEHSGRKTITARDINSSLKRMGRPLY